MTTRKATKPAVRYMCTYEGKDHGVTMLGVGGTPTEAFEDLLTMCGNIGEQDPSADYCYFYILPEPLDMDINTVTKIEVRK